MEGEGGLAEVKKSVDIFGVSHHSSSSKAEVGAGQSPTMRNHNVLRASMVFLLFLAPVNVVCIIVNQISK